MSICLVTLMVFFSHESSTWPFQNHRKSHHVKGWVTHTGMSYLKWTVEKKSSLVILDCVFQDKGPCEIETEPMSGGSELNKYSNQMLFCAMVRHLWRFIQLQEFQHSLMSGHSSLKQDSPVNTIDSHLIVYLGSPVEPLFQNISCAQS